MIPQADSLEQVHAVLMRVRQDPKTRRRYPKSLWDSIIHLTFTHPLKEVCQYLHINTTCLKRKIRESQESTDLDFVEFTQPSQSSSADIVVIELASESGLRAKIQGPLSCLNCIHMLFRS